MSSDFRGSGDDALPAPPGQPQQLNSSAVAGKVSEDSSSKPFTSEMDKQEGVDGDSDDDKSDDGDAPDGTAAEGAPAPPDASNPSPAEAALMKQVNAVLSSEVMRFPALCEANELLIIHRLV